MKISREAVDLKFINIDIGLNCYCSSIRSFIHSTSLTNGCVQLVQFFYSFGTSRIDCKIRFSTI